MAAFATNSPPQRRPFWRFPSLQPPWRGLSISLCKSVSSYRCLSILRLTGSSHISWFSPWAQPVWWQPSPQERYSSRTQRQSGILLAFSSSHPLWRQPSGGFPQPSASAAATFLAIFVPTPPGGPLAAALWQLSSSRPLPQTATCALGRGSRTQKETTWGRRRPLGRGMCALKGTRTWGTLC